MKVALYIEDGLEQIVLTPDSQTEKGILGKLHDGSRDLSIKRGTFYGCQGGWTRWQDGPDYGYSHYNSERDDSTMIVLRPAEPKHQARDTAAAAVIALEMSHHDDCTSSPDHPGVCGCGLYQLRAALGIGASA